KSDEEIGIYGDRIYNIHIKDRVLGGTTVPLGQGNADFRTVFVALSKIKYNNNLIFQSARSADGDHIGAMSKYIEFISPFLKELYGS
ncbi:MAG: sugar phosphate isomerase/epimerase, partial [Pseudobdellovibrionaceae bacterium]